MLRQYSAELIVQIGSTLHLESLRRHIQTYSDTSPDICNTHISLSHQGIKENVFCAKFVGILVALCFPLTTYIDSLRRCVVPTLPCVPSDNARAVADGMDKASNRVQKAQSSCGWRGFLGVCVGCKFCVAHWSYESIWNFSSNFTYWWVQVHDFKRSETLQRSKLYERWWPLVRTARVMKFVFADRNLSPPCRREGWEVLGRRTPKGWTVDKLKGLGKSKVARPF